MSEEGQRAKVNGSQTPSIDWERGVIGGTTLRPQSFEVLKLLMQNPGQVVTKERLMSTVWKDVAVTDDSLVQCILDIRRALHDENHVIIKTLPKRGYVFETPSLPMNHRSRLPLMATLALATVIAGFAVWPRQPLQPAELPAIAVLPFANLGTEEKDNKFAEVLTEDVITDLSHSKDFAVIARNSTEIYKGKSVDVRDIGKALNVKYVVQGSIKTEHAAIRASVQLINAQTGQLVWSDRFENKGGSVFAVEEEITGRIASSIGGHGAAADTAERTLIRRKPPSQWSAYEAYQLGTEAMHNVTPEGLREAEELFNKSIAIDPNFARAYVNLALTISMKIGRDLEKADTALPRQIEAVKKAIELDPQDAQAHAALADIGTWNNDWNLIRVEVERALDLAPNNADILVICSAMLASLGESERAIAAVDQALRLNPNYPKWYVNSLRWPLYLAGDYKRAYDFSKQLDASTASAFELNTVTAAQLAMIEESEKSKKLLLAAVPDWSAEKQTNYWPIMGDATISRFVAAASKAGLRSCMTKDELAAAPKTVEIEQCKAERAEMSP